MATNKVQAGAVLALAVAGGCVSGDPVIVGSISGVALQDIADGDSGQVDTQGVYELPKTAVTIAEGEVAYLTPGGSVTNVSTGNTEYGVFVAAAASGDATAMVKLPG